MRGNRSFIVLSSRSTRQVIISETCCLSSAGISIVQSPFVSTSGGFVRRFARTRRSFRRSFLARLFPLLHFGLRLGGRAIVFEQQPKQLIRAPHLFVRLRLRFGESDQFLVCPGLLRPDLPRRLRSGRRRLEQQSLDALLGRSLLRPGRPLFIG